VTAEVIGEEPIPCPAADLSKEEENDETLQPGAKRPQRELEATTEDNDEAEESEDSDTSTFIFNDAELLEYALQENRRLRTELQTTKEELRDVKEQYGTLLRSLEEK